MDAPPFTIRAIDHILLHVSGMDDSLRFYENVLGCAIESRLPKHGMVELRAGSSHVDLVDVASSEGAWANDSSNGSRGRNVDHFALDIAPRDIPSLRKHLASHGVAIIEEREESSRAGTSLSLYVRDPSGNTVELLARPA